MGIWGRHRGSQGPPFLLPPYTGAERENVLWLRWRGQDKTDVATEVVINAVLNVVQVCILAYLAAKYGPRNGGGGGGGGKTE